nr:MGMT family protein [Streptomyces californicus]
MSQDQTGGGGPGTAPAGGGPPEYAELPAYAERVLDVADLIPPGRVMTYGDVAEWLGDGGPRQVGRAMALYGSAVPWWRVVRSDGTLLPSHELRALEHYRAEGTPLREASRQAEGHIPKLDMRRARWDGRGVEGDRLPVAAARPGGEPGAGPVSTRNPAADRARRPGGTGPGAAGRPGTGAADVTSDAVRPPPSAPPQA